MKKVVVYKSISGFTEKYARWIAEELNADIYDCGSTTADILVGYDVIIFGGSLHAVGINGLNIIKDNWSEIAGKNIIVFATGASPHRDNIPVEILDKNFSKEEQKHITFFYLRGGFDFSKLNFFNRLLMLLMKRKIRRKKTEDRTPDEKGMLAAFENPVDFTKRENIQDLVGYVRKQKKCNC